MLIDTHCHFDYYDKEQKEFAINKLHENNIKAIVMGTGNNNSEVKKLYQNNKKIIIPAYGIYPSNKVRDDILWENSKDVLNFIRENKPTIIGEVGLDKTYDNFNQQKEVFKKVIELSNKLNRPMSIHTRKAEKEVIKMLEKYAKRPSILHCFSGKMKLAKKAINIGHYFSIPTNIKRSEHFKNLVKILDEDKIVLETDSPFLSSDKTTNFPHRIIESIPIINEIKGKEMENIIIKNTKEVLK
ncbi:MAG: TatD family hydrolase [Candidatus Woesearchaeota archaeon]